ncbi:outer membrane beta-barrel protein [Helicobacter sp. 23-1045]
MKIINLVALAIAFATALSAQEISQDAQIEQLEKELRILELQKQIEQAKSGESTQPQQNLDNNSKEPSGFMLGAGLALGYTIDVTYGSTQYYGEYTINNSRVEYGGELLLGYKWFFGESGIFGTRLYADYQFLFSTAGINPIDAHIFSGNLDLMFNFNKSQKFKVGMIVGLHLGGGLTNYKYDRMCSNNYNEGGGVSTTPEWEACPSGDANFSVGGNIGLRFVIKDHHAIEAIVQPRGNLISSDESGLSIIGFARYVYTF